MESKYFEWNDFHSLILLWCNLATVINGCCLVFSYPSKDEKVKLASAIVTALPGLKDSVGVTGFVRYYHL